jgi:hypothetical protein
MCINLSLLFLRLVQRNAWYARNVSDPSVERAADRCRRFVFLRDKRPEQIEFGDRFGSRDLSCRMCVQIDSRCTLSISFCLNLLFILPRTIVQDETNAGLGM